MKKYAFRYMVASGIAEAICFGSSLSVWLIANTLFAVFVYLLATLVDDIKKSN